MILERNGSKDYRSGKCKLICFDSSFLVFCSFVYMMYRNRFKMKRNYS
jgi:hypothetical protein